MTNISKPVSSTPTCSTTPITQKVEFLKNLFPPSSDPSLQFTGNWLIDSNRVRMAEAQSEWGTALHIHNIYHRTEDVQAICLILKSKLVGDFIREKAAPLYEKYENHVLNNKELHTALRDIELEAFEKYKHL